MYGTNPGDDRATLAQSGIWFTERLGGLGTVYSMPFAITFHGELDAPALLAACRTVLARHPVLSCAAQERAGLPVLVPAPVPPQPMTVDLTGTPELLEGLEHAEISRPFDLAQGPLIRCTLFRTAPDRARLLVVAHHLAFDGQSTSVFLDDLAAAYAGTALPALPAAEHPDDQEDRIAEALPGAREFWRRHWSEPEEVQLPGLRGTPAPAAPGEAVEFELPDDLRAAVGGLGLSNFQFTLASWLVLLRRYGNRAPVIGVDLGTRARASGSGSARTSTNSRSPTPPTSPSPSAGTPRPWASRTGSAPTCAASTAIGRSRWPAPSRVSARPSHSPRSPSATAVAWPPRSSRA